MQDYTNNSVQQRDFRINVDVKDGDKVVNKDLTWSVSTGGKISLYGQIIAFGVKHGGLKGNTMRLERKGTTKDDTKYMVIDD